MADETIRSCTKKQKTFVLEYPNSIPTKSLHLLKRKILTISSADVAKRQNLFTNFRKNRKISLELNA